VAYGDIYHVDHTAIPAPDIKDVPALGKADGRDDIVPFFVGSNYFGNLGAEIEGKIVVLGNFIDNSISSLVQVGLGSHIIPNNDQDVVLVGGNWSMNVDVAVMQNSAHVRGNIKHKRVPVLETHRLWTNGSVEHVPHLNLTVYNKALKELKSQIGLLGVS
jgi:choice-of-anchor A domain-containing protein